MISCRPALAYTTFIYHFDQYCARLADIYPRFSWRNELHGNPRLPIGVSSMYANCDSLKETRVMIAMIGVSLHCQESSLLPWHHSRLMHVPLICPFVFVSSHVACNK
jgi:hypothetical protein